MLFNNSGNFQVTYSDENAAGVTYTRTATITVVPVENATVAQPISVDPADYYDYTQAGVVPDTDPQVREEVGVATSVDPANYYDYTQAGVVTDTDPQVREEVGAATFVDPADYYDYTQAGVMPDTDPQVREEVGAATSVDPANYYDYTQAGVVPDTDPEFREEVGAATSVTADAYYDHTGATAEPKGDEAETDQQPALPQTGRSVIDTQPVTTPKSAVKVDATVLTDHGTTTVTTTTASPLAGQQLPQTGERHQNSLMLVGLALLALVGLAGLGRSRKQRA